MSTKVEIKLRWKVTAVFENEVPVHHSSVLFNLSPNTGLYSQFSIPLRHSYVPQVLSPTVTFHQVVQNLLEKSLNIEVRERKFPYRIYVPRLDAHVLFNLGIRLFLPNILSLTVKLSDYSTSYLDVTKLLDCQRLDYLRPISDITQWTIGLVETLDHKDFELSHPLRFKPALHLGRVCDPAKFSAHIRENLSKYVGVLIRNYDYELMDSKIPKHVLEKNKEHNLKSSQELLLIDKQGILYVTPDRIQKTTPSRPKFSRTYDLFGIALVFKDYINNYHAIRLANGDLADFLLYKIKPWIDEPDIVFGASMSNKYRWSLFVNEFGLKSRMRHIMNRATEDALERKSRYFDQFATDWWNESDFGYLLAGKIRESEDLQLAFLDNEDLKKLIAEDYAEAWRSFQGRNYKATILLCGSIAEAILTAVIEKAGLPGITAKKLYWDYNLSKLVDLAEQHQLIQDKALFSLFDPLRNYRNAIHPGVQIRKSLTLDSSKARIALETVNLLIKDLSKAS
jgi:hypothetical protein